MGYSFISLRQRLPTVKILSKTRWSARVNASKAIYKLYKPIIAALQDINKSTDDGKEDQLEAKLLSEKLKYLETAFRMKS